MVSRNISPFVNHLLKDNSIEDSILSNARKGMGAGQGRKMSDLDDLLQMDVNNCFVKHIHLRAGKSCALSVLHGPVSRNGQDFTFPRREYSTHSRQAWVEMRGSSHYPAARYTSAVFR
jgi:hypothetical protein